MPVYLTAFPKTSTDEHNFRAPDLPNPLEQKENRPLPEEIPKTISQTTMKNYHDRIKEAFDAEKNNIRTYERNGIVADSVIESLSRIQNAVFVIFPEPDNSPDYVKRRRLLKHEDDCQMKQNVALNCTCHYDDCLNHRTPFLSECICKKITSHDNFARAIFAYEKLPWFKKLRTAKPRLFNYLIP